MTQKQRLLHTLLLFNKSSVLQPTKRTFTNVAHTLFSKEQPSKAAMAPVRFFPNPVADIADNSSEIIHIPTDGIRSTILNILEKINNYLKPTLSNAGDGLYLGTAGVAYMYYYLSKMPALSQHHGGFMAQAVDYVNPALTVARKNEKRRSEVPAFLLGNCGIYAVASVIFNAVGDKVQSHHYLKSYHEAANICKEMRFLDCGSDELFVGRAGKEFVEFYVKTLLVRNVTFL